MNTMKQKVQSDVEVDETCKQRKHKMLGNWYKVTGTRLLICLHACNADYHDTTKLQETEKD